VLVALVLVLAVLGGMWVWLRDSSLVAVRRVQVAGASGPDGAAIRQALVSAARTMTTLDVKMSQLRMAVEPYPVVKSLRVDTQFPHGMRIHVVEQVPVAVVDAGGRKTAVSGDGTLLHDVAPMSSLPTISLGIAPGGTHLTGYALTEARLLASAPWQLLGKVASVSDGSAHGLVAQLRNGPSLYFGDSSQLGAKWTAAAEVVADSGSAGAAYVDVTDPSRPAAGAGSNAASTASPSASTAASPASPSASATGAPAAPTSSAPSGSTATGG
jgi:cell division protein FtsQ